MNAEDRPSSGLTARQRWSLALAAFGRALVRLLAILIVAGLLAALLFWGVPAFTRRFLLPVEENRERLEQFQASQEQSNQQLSQGMERMQSRLGTLEAQSDQDAQQNARTIAGLQTKLDEAQKTLESRLAGSQSDLAGAQERLDAFGGSLQELSAAVDRLSAVQKAAQDDLGAIAGQEDARNSSLEALRREIQVMKAMELLLRSRLFLGQSNFGLARQDVQSARDLLAGLAKQAPAYQVRALDEIVARLELALGNLPDRPVFAADDLEIAWGLLVQGLPGEAEATPTPSLAASGAFSATITASPTITATLTATLTVTATVEMTPSPSPAFTPTGETPPTAP